MREKQGATSYHRHAPKPAREHLQGEGGCDMNTLYWLTVLGELKNFLLIIALISSIVTVICFMAYLAGDNLGKEKNYFNDYLKLI